MALVTLLQPDIAEWKRIEGLRKRELERDSNHYINNSAVQQLL